MRVFRVVVILPVIFVRVVDDFFNGVERPHEIELVAVGRTQEMLVGPPRASLALRSRRRVSEPENIRSRRSTPAQPL